MQELINKLMSNAELSAGQAAKVLDTIKDFVKEKYPMMAGAVDKLFEDAGNDAPDMHADPLD